MKRSSSIPAGEGAPVATSFRQKIFLVAFGLALSVLGLGLVEGLLAVLDLGDRHLYEDPFVGFSPGQDLFAEKSLADGRRVYATTPGKLSFFDYQEFSAEKASDTLRIFALGGSTTAGRPYDSRVAFPRWMELYLEAMDPKRRYEVVNAGAISYASYRIVLLMKELVLYQPDLFVIYTGHNEFLEERTYADIIHQNLALKKLRIWLGGFRLYTLARHGWLSLRDKPAAGTTLESEVAASLDGWAGLDLYHRDDELRRSVIEHFEYNLHQMVAIARDHGAEVIFVAPVSNLKDFSPFKSEHSAAISRQQAAALDALLADGRALLEAGQAPAAAEVLRKVLAEDPEYAEAHFRLGRCLLQLGDVAGARAAFVAAKDLDVAPLRALGAIEEQVRTVAAEYELALIDLPGILEADSRERYGHSILGDEYLLDHVHPDFPVHGLIAEQVIDVLLENGTVRRDPAWSEEKRQAVSDRLEASLDREYYAQRDHNLSKVLAWAGKLEEAEAPLLRAAAVLTENPEVWLNQGILYEKTGRWQQAVRALRRAVALDPTLAEAHFNLGTNLGYLGRAEEGIASLRQAIRLREDYPLAHFNLGIIYREQGALAEAITAFERAAELNPEAAEVPRNLGLIYRRQGRMDRAIAAFHRALELDCEDVGARTELGITYGRQGRLEEATRELQKAIELDPRHAEAHYNLAVVFSQRRMPEAATEAYERSLEVDPDDAKARNNLGILYARQARLEEAERQLKGAIEIDPGYAEAHFNLGLVYHDTGRLGEALGAMRRALDLDPANVPMNTTIASLYRAVGDGDRARFHLEKAKRAEAGAPP